MTRRIPVTAGLLAFALLTAGCSGGDGSVTGSSASDDTSFAVTIEHKFGITEITEEPGRVLALGYQEHDPILALGVTPIGVRYWFGDESDVIFPWAEDEAGDANPEILNMPDGINFERIAALNPDSSSGCTRG